MHTTLDNPANKVKAYLKDLSREGLRMNCNDPLHKGSKLEIEMLIPGDNIPIIVSGEVAWSTRVDKGSYDSGVKLTKIERFDRARLLDYVYDEWIKTKVGQKDS
jgi:hypothetical protein